MKALNVLPCFSEPRATSAIPDIRGFIGMVLDQGHAYQAGGAVYFDVSSFAGFGRGQPLLDREDDASSPPSAAATSTIRTSAIPSTSCLWQPSARRRAGVGDDVGPRATRLAHRVLGARAPRARHHHRSARRRHRPDLPAPRVRAGPVARRRPASRSCGTGCTSAMVRMDGEKMSKSLGNLVFVERPAEDVGPAGDPPGHHRAPLPRLVGVGRASSCHAPRPGSGLARRRRPGDGSARRGTGRARRRPRHPRGARGDRRCSREWPACPQCRCPAGRGSVDR